MSHISVRTSFQKEIPLRIFTLRLILSVNVTFEAIWAGGVHLKFYQPVYGDSVLLDQQYVFDVRSLIRVEKVLLIRNDPAAALF